RVFGCIAFAHIPDSQRKKLDNKSIKCVHLGISDESKAYKLYNPKKSDGNEVLIDTEEITTTNNEPIEPHITHEPHASPLSNSDMDIGYESTDAEDEVVEEYNNEEDSNQLGPRIKRLPSHFKDFVMDSEVDNEQELQNFAIYSSSEDPYTYDEACKHQVWKDAMDAEIKAIEDNNTWELSNLPEGIKAIGVKWIYKTKYNEMRQIDKHKARLVAKGYTQKYGIDYSEVFAPV
ncbi:retrovirus-related Pol polyprotein from transposon TNT 1-94, partial [Trifolium pratense]